MTISIARLTAHSGVKYLLKTTMHDDAPRTTGDATNYYMKTGTPSGRWLGSGLAGIDRSPLDSVTRGDASAVFTNAVHPDTHQPLGRPHGETTIAHRNSEEIQRAAIAGFDLTFSVPKSVSVLWALAPHEVQQQVLAAHHDAVNEVLEWLEQSAIHTRTGRGGVAHVAIKGAIAAAFDHWESRARDPQLHTHVVIANRVQRVTDGAWTSVDSRTLYKATVAASEHYNGLLFDRLQERLGAVPGFRPPANRVRNPRHELVGVDDALIHEFSSRTHLIDEEKDRLVTAWTEEHGKSPSPTTVVKLRQQATLSTRQPKGTDPQPLFDLAQAWRSRSERLGFEPAEVINNTICRSYERPATSHDLTEPWIAAAADAARQAVAQRRATWNRWNLLAEAERICSEIRCASSADRRDLIDAVATTAESQCISLNAYRYSVPINAGDDVAFAAHAVFEFHGARLYTDAGIIANEQLVMDASNDICGPSIRSELTDDLLTRGRSGDVRTTLVADQSAAVCEVLSSGRLLDAVVGPAGSGKTTTMAALRNGWEQFYGAGSVIGLAPAAASAKVLGQELGLAAENVAKWLYETVGQGAVQRAEQFRALDATDPQLSWQKIRTAQRLANLALRQTQWSFRRNQLVIVDEASMVSTVQLAALVHQVRDAGAKILLVGDPAQLDAIDAGGILGWLDRAGKAVQLTTVQRFRSDWEGPASLLLREGDITAVHAYAEHGRIRHGSYDEMVDQAYEHWTSDIQSGGTSILIAPDNEAVTVLNERAHAELVLQGKVDAERTVVLNDGLSAGRGDTIIARMNDRRVTDDSGDFIRNGVLIKITAKPSYDGSVIGRRLDTGRNIRLSSEYLSEAAELGYATTAHRSQGITVGTSHTLLTQARLTRELFYVSMTRGRDSNTAYVCESDPVHDDELHTVPESSWQQIMGEVLASQGAEQTAHEVYEWEQRNAYSLHRLADEYDYLAQITAADDLRAAIEGIRPGTANALECSPAWGAGVTAWRQAIVAQPRAASLTLEHTIRRPGDAKDVMAVLHSRLRLVSGSKAIGMDFWLHENLSSSRADLTSMITQVRRLIDSRIQEVKAEALTGIAPWTRRLAGVIPDGTSEVDRRTIVGHVAIYRDRWLIGADAEPLGPSPADYEWERAKDRRQLEVEIARLQSPSIASSDTAVTNVLVGAALTNVGWEI